MTSLPKLPASRLPLQFRMRLWFWETVLGLLELTGLYGTALHRVCCRRFGKLVFGQLPGGERE